MSQHKFDVLVLDAFSSDAIPAHLLTREAVSLYRRRLDDDGLLAIHVSNRHLDLEPLVHRLSRDAGLNSRVVRSEADRSAGTTAAIWLLITRPGHPIWNHQSLAGARPASKADLVDAPLWTDQRHNLFSVLRLW
jgi:hypothetical protein